MDASVDPTEARKATVRCFGRSNDARNAEEFDPPPISGRKIARPWDDWLGELIAFLKPTASRAFASTARAAERQQWLEHRTILDRSRHLQEAPLSRRRERVEPGAELYPTLRPDSDSIDPWRREPRCDRSRGWIDVGEGSANPRRERLGRRREPAAILRCDPTAKTIARELRR